MKAIAKFEKKNSEQYYQTLDGHAADALKILRTYINKNYNVMKEFCSRWNIKIDDFLRSAFITVYLHDIGKLTEEFQRNIQQGKHSQQLPHAFFALPIIMNLDIRRLFGLPLESVVILGHHTQLYGQLYEDVNTRPHYLNKEINRFLKRSIEVYHDMKFDKYFDFDGFSTIQIERSKPSFIRRYIREVIKETSFFGDKVKIKAVFSFLFSLLQLCDDYSSAAFSDFLKDYSGNERELSSIFGREDCKMVPGNYVVELPRIMKKDILKDPETGKINELYPYQNEIKEKAPKFCLLFAPCGRGKTEAALLWALEVCRRHDRNKIIFAMPTQTTSDAMDRRFCEIFGGNNTGLFHGRSFLEHEKKLGKNIEDGLTGEDLEEIKGENFKGSVFFKPVTVTTIDHLIYTFVHGFRQADFALGNLQNAVIIFDEVHYYEKQTLEHLITLFKILRKMHIPHLLMSGTMPEFFIKKVKEINPLYYGPIIDGEGLKYTPFKIKVENKPLVMGDNANANIIREIIDNYNIGINQFIILNTVKRSQRVYEGLKNRIEDLNIVLLHSEFIWTDKKEKEEKIIEKIKIKKEKPLIFVSTQMIEVSLDISCDKMYTELAPADALGQRGGRLNRGKKTPNGSEMKIFLTEELLQKKKSEKPRPYDLSLLEKTKDLLNERAYSYEDIKQVCNCVYENVKLKTTKLEEIFYECCLFGPSPHDVCFGEYEGGKMLEIRSDSFKKVDIIPRSVFNKKIGKFCRNERITLLSNMESLSTIDIIKSLNMEIAKKFESEKFPLKITEDEIKIRNSAEKINREMRERANILLKKLFSVKNKGKVPFYLYIKDREKNIFEFIKVKNKWNEIANIPYSSDIGFDYRNIIPKSSTFPSRII